MIEQWHPQYENNTYEDSFLLQASLGLSDEEEKHHMYREALESMIDETIASLDSAISRIDNYLKTVNH